MDYWGVRYSTAQPDTYHQEQLKLFYAPNVQDMYDPLLGEAVPPSDKLWIGFAFLRADEMIAQQCVTKIQSLCDPGRLLHVEAYFPQTRETCSVDVARPVHFRTDKNYTIRHWKWIYVSVSEREYQACYSYLQQRCGQSFDKVSLWLFCCGTCCYTPRRDPTSWHCSRLLASMLKRARVLDVTVDSDFITPSTLYSELCTLEVTQASTRSIWKTRTGNKNQ